MAGAPKQRQLGLKGAALRVLLGDAIAVLALSAAAAGLEPMAGATPGLMPLLAFGAFGFLAVPMIRPIRNWTYSELAWGRTWPAYLFLFFILVMAAGLKTLSLLQASLCFVAAASFLMLSRLATTWFLLRWTGGTGPLHRVGLIGISDLPAKEREELLRGLNRIEVVETRELADPRAAIALGQIDEILAIGPNNLSANPLVMSDGQWLPVDISLKCKSPEPDGRCDRLLFLNGWRLDVAQSMPLGEGMAWFKGLIDTLLAALLLLFFAPLLAIIWLAVRLTSPGSPVFKQERVGRHQEPFTIYKFRTLFSDQEDRHSRRQARLSDPRVTAVGRFLRASCLDELPQLFNVLKGDMALVGPRPHAPLTEIGGRVLEEWLPDYKFRHCVKPGLTGLAQVNGCRGPLESVSSLERRLSFDLDYIRNWSWIGDMVILLKSLGVPFAGLYQRSRHEQEARASSSLE